MLLLLHLLYFRHSRHAFNIAQSWLVEIIWLQSRQGLLSSGIQNSKVSCLSLTAFDFYWFTWYPQLLIWSNTLSVAYLCIRKVLRIQERPTEFMQLSSFSSFKDIVQSKDGQQGWECCSSAQAHLSTLLVRTLIRSSLHLKDESWISNRQKLHYHWELDFLWIAALSLWRKLNASQTLFHNDLAIF